MQTNNLLDQCKQITNRMLDSICRYIPEWGTTTVDLIEIRKDVVSSLNNIEIVLNELLLKQARSSRDNQINTINQLIIDERNRLQQDLQNMGMNEELINQLYSLVFGHSSSLSIGDRLSMVISEVSQILNQLHISSIKDVFVFSLLSSLLYLISSFIFFLLNRKK